MLDFFDFAAKLLYFIEITKYSRHFLLTFLIKKGDIRIEDAAPVIYNSDESRLLLDVLLSILDKQTAVGNATAEVVSRSVNRRSCLYALNSCLAALTDEGD